MKKTSSLIIYTILILSFSLGAVEVLLNLRGEETSASTQAIWGIIFLFLTIFWVYADAERKDFERPFDFGFLVYVFWYVAFPWYLIKTRGIEGILVLIGFLSLWIAPWLAGLVAYAYFTE